MPQASPWWMPDIHADRQPFLQARRRILAALRSHLEARDFVEVETAILQRSPGNEAHLHAFATELVAPDRTAHGAPFAHVAGIRLQEAVWPPASAASSSSPGSSAIASAVHCITPNSPCSNGIGLAEPYETLMADCAAFLAAAATAAGATQLRFRGRSADPFAAPERLTVAEAFARHAGIDLLATLRGGAPDRAALAAQARRPASGSPTTTAGATYSAG